MQNIINKLTHSLTEQIGQIDGLRKPPWGAWHLLWALLDNELLVPIFRDRIELPVLMTMKGGPWKQKPWTLETSSRDVGAGHHMGPG